MNVIDLFLTSIYLHFCAMKERGRPVVPWFQTSFAIALFTAIAAAMLAKVIGRSAINKESLPESIFLIVFAAIGFATFFLIKRYYFDSGKHLTLSEQYTANYTAQKRSLIKAISIGMLFLVPLLLGCVMWLQIM